MHAAALKAIDFKDSLVVCYPDIEPLLLKELNTLRDQLILLHDNTPTKQILLLFQQCVEKLNEIDDDDTLASGIDTEEREGLCDALYRMGDIVGLDSESEYIDNWREW
jgi:Domain of unknown function (DUF4844)